VCGVFDQKEPTDAHRPHFVGPFTHAILQQLDSLVGLRDSSRLPLVKSFTRDRFRAAQALLRGAHAHVATITIVVGGFGSTEAVQRLSVEQLPAWLRETVGVPISDEEAAALRLSKLQGTTLLDRDVSADLARCGISEDRIALIQQALSMLEGPRTGTLVSLP
jgi:hypothetical protein